jgi:hypothetical protein
MTCCGRLTSGSGLESRPMSQIYGQHMTMVTPNPFHVTIEPHLVDRKQSRTSHTKYYKYDNSDK